jgi:cobaltochelatase CobS
MTTTVSPSDMIGDKLICKLCGSAEHSIKLHLDKAHPGITQEDYLAKFPGAPMLSPIAQQALAARQAAGATAAAPAVAAVTGSGKQAFHDVFALGTAPAAMNALGKPIQITVLQPDPEGSPFVPPVDLDYVFPVDVLKNVVMAMEMNIPAYIWGHAGTGKTTLLSQIAARTGRPVLRVQHTANMEEDQIVGGWRVRAGQTVFELGPLAMAMKYGWTYIADEYDFGRPEVLSVYQAVLEGAPLFIKEADLANRIIRPDANFRILATGNTNGQGDESGLYGGTNMQNAANFERFGVVQQMPWMEFETEARVISRKAKIPLDDAKKLVDFAKRVREEFDGQKMSNPISPRSLIYAGKLGIARKNYQIGLELAFLNRLTAVDREAATQLAQRTFAAAI